MNTEIQKQFVSFEIAVRLKTLGFNEPCFGFFTGNNEEIDLSTDSLFTNKTLSRINKLRGGLERFQITAPLFQQCKDWIRENYKLDISINRNYDGWRFTITEFSSGNKSLFCSNNETEDYIEEMKLAILKAIELIEKQK